jgi:hypothetical protein
MKKFWKCLLIALMAAAFGLFSITLSMYWWPGIPSSPRPAEGRVYPLNNHGYYTYMNKSEYRLQQIFWWTYPALIAALAAIQHFVDPFDYKRRQRFFR